MMSEQQVTRQEAAEAKTICWFRGRGRPKKNAVISENDDAADVGDNMKKVSKKGGGGPAKKKTVGNHDDSSGDGERRIDRRE